ncbi:hypothetical protein BXZ70DRAFT_735785 [Cristinia sonorae]|uniref:BTB domain-containing protein n=1 Tax=Cristinia sonorae TaxID=1940300 RepID=A0A8K0UU49_9AGAR|nr:hypothetical protein BXZ70DRAFT_735785 [Cristinia sonorae]
MTSLGDPRYLGELESPTALDYAHETCLVPRTKVHRHQQYYFEDGNLTILVEDTLFRVFRSTFIRHSPVFGDLFSLPEPAGQTSEGSSDDNPLYFSGILSADFERLLWVIYPPSYEKHKAETFDEWTSILHLATRWDFTDIRSLAIRSIQSLNITPVDRIVLSREYDISGRWTLAGYTALCDRHEPLSYAEATRLGLETSIRISQLREQLRYKGPGGGGHQSLTRTAAARRAATLPAPSSAARGSRVSFGAWPTWDVARSFLDQETIPPPTRTNTARSVKSASAAKTRNPAQALSRNARLVADAFGIEIAGR